MLTQLIVTSAATGTWAPRAARQIALAKPLQFHIKNTVKLRGFLGKDAEVPDSSIVTWHSYAVLTLCTGSGTWNKAANEFIPRTDTHWIICSGPFFCGLIRGMKQGDYIEVEGELRGTNAGSSIQALQIRRLEYPHVGVEKSNDD